MIDNPGCPNCRYPGFICGIGAVMWLRCHRCGIDYEQDVVSHGARLVVVPTVMDGLS